MNETARKLYNAAFEVIKPCKVSQHIFTGSVGAAVLTKGGNIYTGVCIDTSCSLGMCAERNALSTMITNGECEPVMVCAVFEDGSIMAPCGACREFMMQLGENARDIEIIINDQGKTVRLGELMPEYQY